MSLSLEQPRLPVGSGARKVLNTWPTWWIWISTFRASCKVCSSIMDPVSLPADRSAWTHIHSYHIRTSCVMLTASCKTQNRNRSDQQNHSTVTAAHVPSQAEHSAVPLLKIWTTVLWAYVWYSSIKPWFWFWPFGLWFWEWFRVGSQFCVVLRHGLRFYLVL